MTDLVIQQGTDTEIRVPNVRDTDGVLITEWSDYSIAAQVRARVESATVLHEWSTDDGSASFDGSDLVLSITAAASAAWTWTTGRYDVELTNPDDKVARVAAGHITVDREVTR